MKWIDLVWYPEPWMDDIEWLHEEIIYPRCKCDKDIQNVKGGLKWKKR